MNLDGVTFGDETLAVETFALDVRRQGHIQPDPARVIAQLFVPGHYLSGGREGQASGVVEHILALGDDEVDETLASIVDRFADRHRDLAETFRHHADRIGNRLDPANELSEERRLLLGATFTHEYAVEAAALCNPSAVALPDQTRTPAGALRFVMSVRQIGEGHRSSVGFRTGLLDARGDVTMEDPGPFTTAGTIGTSTLDADTFRGLARRRDDTEAIGWVLDRLGHHFTIPELEARLSQLEAQHDTRRNVSKTITWLRDLAARAYTAQFPASSELAERVLYPATSIESNGMEDARFVRFVDDDGAVTYYATYTAFDGRAIAQQLLATTDFLTFTVSPLLGAAAANKGMALFPRRINGQLVALSRYDGASNAIAFSDNIREWPTATPLACPTEAWEAIQVGNCGPPIETSDGWLVLTHGVGPMRTYSIGAMLLDLGDPTKVIGRLRRPMLTPLPGEQDGYVPNVVYSCGAVLHDATLLIPFGIADSSISFATVPMPALLGAMIDATV
ncbi:MAG: hypothetical protein QOF97_1236 [Acidimicrobiaceae bacterium]